MRTSPLLAHLLLALRLGLGLAFAIAVVPKLRRPLTFAQTVVDYRILPAPLARAFGLALLPVEALLALALLTGTGLWVVLPGASLVLAAFLAAVGINLRRGRRISCGCMGRGGERISGRTAARLSLLLTVSLALTAAWVFGLEMAEPGGGAAGWLALHHAACTLFLAAGFLILGAWTLRGPDLWPMLKAWRQPRRPRASHLHAAPE